MEGLLNGVGRASAFTDRLLHQCCYVGFVRCLHVTLITGAKVIVAEYPLGESSVLLSLGDGRKIECKLYGAPLDQAKGVAVMCHPHSLFGGTMDNKVVHTLWRTFKSIGMNVLRFNFRGVGASEGQYDHGQGETDDLAEIMDWIAVKFPRQPIYLAGFSFGAYVAAAYVTRDRHVPLKRVFLIAPPVHHFAMERIEHLNVPVSIVMGERDELVPVEQVRRWADKLAERSVVQVHMLPDATHFFHGQLLALKEKMLQDLAV